MNKPERRIDLLLARLRAENTLLLRMIHRGHNIRQAAHRLKVAPHAVHRPALPQPGAARRTVV